jgi:hypothetical protein
MRRTLGLAVVLTLAAAGCGDDGDGGGTSGGGGDGDGGGGDAQAFCDRLEELDSEANLSVDDIEGIEALVDLIDLAPEDVADDLDRLRQAAEDLSDLDQDDPDSFEAAFEVILDPQLLEALSDFGDFATDECGLEVEGTDFDPDNPFGDLSSDLSTDLSSDATDDEPSNTDLLGAYIDDHYGDEDWVDVIGSRSVGSVEGVQATVTLGLNEVVDSDAAVEVCEAALAWGEDAGYPDVDAEVQGPDQETLAAGDLDGGCEAA